MDTQKYRALLEAIDCGSITEAAIRMGYTQSALSRMVAELERQWDVILLHRGKSGVQPTADARSLISHIRALVAAEDNLNVQISAVKGLEAGSLRIATFSSVATHWLPSIVNQLQHDHPGIVCELLLGDYDEIESWVEEGRADCGFLGRRPYGNLDAWQAGQDQFMAVLPSDHFLGHAPAFPVEAFADEPFLLLTTGVEEVVARINAHTEKPIAPALSTFDDYAIMAMVESGMGLAILPSLILRRIDYNLCILPLSTPEFREITLVTKKGPQSAAMSEFLSYLEAFLAQA